MDIKRRILNKVNELLVSEQYQAIEFLMHEKIRCAIIKGAVLSKYCYKDAFSRGIGDIDILISKSELSKLEELLRENDFSLLAENFRNARVQRLFMLTASHQVPAYKKKLHNSNIVLDVNFDIFWGEYEGKRIDMEEFLSDTIEMDVYGVKVKTLLPIKAMLQLILHHYKDMNSIFLLATRKSIKYDMFKDVYYLLKNNLESITLNKLYTMSKEYEIIPYVFYVLYYTGQVFEDEILKQYIEAFRTLEGESLLNCYGLCAKERKEWKCDFKTRLESNDLYSLIKDDLTEKDMEKISINKRIFMGASE